MHRTTKDKARGIRWTPFSTLEDLDCADDLVLVSHTTSTRRKKMLHLSNFAQQIGLEISQKNTELMTLNITNPSPIQVNGEDLHTTEEFTYLGSIVRQDGGAGNNIGNRLN